jgi:hypothetical protein
VALSKLKMAGIAAHGEEVPQSVREKCIRILGDHQKSELSDEQFREQQLAEVVL